jgi:hypothetical protein
LVASLDEQLQEVLKWLQENARWLLILDNVDTEAGKDAVLDLLPQLTNGHVRDHFAAGDVDGDD